MQQWKPLHNAIGADDNIDRFANRYPLFSEYSEILSTLHSELISPHPAERKVKGRSLE